MSGDDVPETEEQNIQYLPDIVLDTEEPDVLPYIVPDTEEQNDLLEMVPQTEEQEDLSSLIVPDSEEDDDYQPPRKLMQKREEIIQLQIEEPSETIKNFIRIYLPAYDL